MPEKVRKAGQKICPSTQSFKNLTTMASSANKNQVSSWHHHSEKLVVEYGSLTHVLGNCFEIFDKYVRLFDLYFVATPSSPAQKLLHGAKICYQYIDNDDDGQPDNMDVYMQLLKKKATMIMFKDKAESKLKYGPLAKKIKEEGGHVWIQDLEAGETGEAGKFDEALEETFHFLTKGYTWAYPGIFGSEKDTYIGKCCDAARGGHFEKPPLKYPAQAWFTYYDPTCVYQCQIIEYLYWAMTSILGAQKDRKKILNEWRLNTKKLVEERDPAVYALLTDPFFRLPKRLPHSKLMESGTGNVQCKFQRRKKGCCSCAFVSQLIKRLKK